MNKTLRYALMSLALAALVGCNNVKQQLGLDKSAPDEFSVVKEAPLSMPPDYALRPPEPGIGRPQDTPATQQARETVFGNDGEEARAHVSDSNASILQMAGAANTDPGIRGRVDHEASIAKPQRVTALQKLHIAHVAPEPANVVNAPAEAARLNGDVDTGKPLTAGVTPGIQQ